MDGSSVQVGWAETDHTRERWPAIFIGQALLTVDGEDISLLCHGPMKSEEFEADSLIAAWDKAPKEADGDFFAEVGYLSLDAAARRLVVNSFLAPDSPLDDAVLAEVLVVEARRCVRRLADQWIRTADVGAWLARITKVLEVMKADEQLQRVKTLAGLVSQLQSLDDEGVKSLTSSSEFAPDLGIDRMMLAEPGITDGSYGVGRFKHPGRFRLEVWLRRFRRDRLVRLADYWDSPFPTRNVHVGAGEVRLLSLGERVQRAGAFLVGAQVSRSEFLEWCR